MKIQRFQAHNPDAVQQVKPIDVVTENCTRLDTVLKYLKMLKPDLTIKYIPAIIKLLRDDIDNFEIDYSPLELDDFENNLEELSLYPELFGLVVQFSIYYLKVTEIISAEDEVEVPIPDWLQSTNVFRYHRVKAIVDIMEREEGIKLWKRMVYKATEDSLERSDDEIHPPIKEITEGWIKAGEKDDASFVFTVAEYDDHKVALKFDRCPVYDSISHLEDREVAYLSYCWTGFPEEELNKRSRRKNTPQTLYQADYCIEFYWNNDVHPDAQPPSDEFWRKIEVEE